jgi:hypothetical protein
MNEELDRILSASEQKVSSLREPMRELEMFSGNPPTAALKEYERTRTEALKLDCEIAEMLPPKKDEEKKVLEAMVRLEMTVNSAATLATILSEEVKVAKRKFYNLRGAINDALIVTEAKADNQIMEGFQIAAKGLRAHWAASEKKFRLNQYLVGLKNEIDNPVGISIAPPERISLPWGGGILPLQNKFIEAYLTHFLLVIGRFQPEDLTFENFKQR